MCGSTDQEFQTCTPTPCRHTGGLGTKQCPRHFLEMTSGFALLELAAARKKASRAWRRE